MMTAAPLNRGALAGVPLGQVRGPVQEAGWFVWSLLHAASIGASAYHGYKRNSSVGWAIGWGILGGIFPILTPAIAIGQGFGKRK